MHELNHNLRYSNVVWDPTTVTVGEQVIRVALDGCAGSGLPLLGQLPT